MIDLYAALSHHLFQISRLARSRQAKARSRDTSSARLRDLDRRIAQAGAAIGCISFLGKPIQSREILDDGLVALAGYVDDASRKLVVALPQSPAREHFAAFIASERVTPVLAPSRERLLATLTDDNPYAAVIDAQLFASCAYEIEEILMKRKRLAPFQLIVYAPDDQSNMAAHTSEHFTCHIASHMTGLLDATIASLHIDRKWLASLRAK